MLQDLFDLCYLENQSNPFIGSESETLAEPFLISQYSWYHFYEVIWVIIPILELESAAALSLCLV